MAARNPGQPLRARARAARPAAADEIVSVEDADRSDGIAPEYDRYVAGQRRAAGREAPPRAASGQLGEPVRVDPKSAAELLRVAARRASGFVRPGSGEQHPQVLWVDGDNALAVLIARVDVRFAEGAITVRIPVRCDQTGDALVEVLFATGSADRPAGLYAAAQRRPRGPEIVVATWGDSLVAFAWEAVLGMVAGLAAASGKDTRGNVLVPAEMVASANGLVLQPMARHRFAGGSGLKPTTKISTGGVQPQRARRGATR
jgi:hypothetical protein